MVVLLRGLRVLRGESAFPVLFSSVSSVSWLPCLGQPTHPRRPEDCERRRGDAEVGNHTECRFLCATASPREPIGIDNTLGRQECLPSSLTRKAHSAFGFPLSAFAWVIPAQRALHSAFRSPAHLFSPLLSRRVQRTQRGGGQFACRKCSAPSLRSPQRHQARAGSSSAPIGKHSKGIHHAAPTSPPPKPHRQVVRNGQLWKTGLLLSNNFATLEFG